MQRCDLESLGGVEEAWGLDLESNLRGKGLGNARLVRRGVGPGRVRGKLGRGIRKAAGWPQQNTSYVTLHVPLGGPPISMLRPHAETCFEKVVPLSLFWEEMVWGLETPDLSLYHGKGNFGDAKKTLEHEV